MAVTVNRYPASGGSVTYWIENLNDTSKIIHFDVTVNAGHKLTYYKYSNDVASNQASRNIAGPVTRTDFYAQSYGTESVRNHVFSVFFDGADPDHEDEYYDLDVIVSASPEGAGTVTAVPSEFTDVNVGVAVKPYIGLDAAVALIGIILEHMSVNGVVALYLLVGYCGPCRNTGSG